MMKAIIITIGVILISITGFTQDVLIHNIYDTDNSIIVTYKDSSIYVNKKEMPYNTFTYSEEEIIRAYRNIIVNNKKVQDWIDHVLLVQQRIFQYRESINVPYKTQKYKEADYSDQVKTYNFVELIKSKLQ